MNDLDRKLIYKGKKRERIDVHLKSILKISREIIKPLLQEGQILLRNRQVEPSYLLKDGDEILIKAGVLNSRESTILPEGYALDIIYIDEDIIVVNKPAGILTHPTEKIKSGTMVNFLLGVTSLSEADNPLRQGVVHRLDRETSGVMVFARTDNARENLTLQFKNRTVEKEYLAIVQGKFSPLRKEIEFTVTHSKKNYTKMKTQYLKGKKAITIIEVIKYLDGLTLVKAKPITGRTHQIRLALSHSGYPIIGDTQYGVPSEDISRVALHSYKISFLHPSINERCQFKADIPDDFLQIIDKVDNSV